MPLIFRFALMSHLLQMPSKSLNLATSSFLGTSSTNVSRLIRLCISSKSLKVWLWKRDNKYCRRITFIIHYHMQLAQFAEPGHIFFNDDRCMHICSCYNWFDDDDREEANDCTTNRERSIPKNAVLRCRNCSIEIDVGRIPNQSKA